MNAAVIVAGGQGLRLRGTVKKQYRLLSGLPVLAHTLLAFDRCFEVEKLFLVVPPEDMDDCHGELLPELAPRLTTPVQLVAGGARRQDSVYQGLLACENQAAIVLIHDGVRPLVSPRLMQDAIEGARAHGACIPAVPASETLKQANENGWIRTTLARERIWLAQTPQTFAYDIIRQAHEAARSHGITATDDAFLVEWSGRPVRIIPGSRLNIKITTPEDLVLAEALLKARPQMAD